LRRRRWRRCWFRRDIEGIYNSARRGHLFGAAHRQTESSPDAASSPRRRIGRRSRAARRLRDGAADGRHDVAASRSAAARGTDAEAAGTGYVWQPGEYVPREGHGNLYMPGYWAQSAAGWQWQPPHWLQ
jgi:hypothetical protein